MNKNAHAIGKKCDKCGNDLWLTLDNPDYYYETCYNCAEQITYSKQKYLDDFECPNCGGLNGEKEENKRKFGIRCKNCNELTIYIEKSEKAIDNRVPLLDRLREQQPQQPEQNIPKCPKCGSTQIATGARGYKFLTGFLGSSKTVNRCGSCGYSWEPKKR